MGLCAQVNITGHVPQENKLRSDAQIRIDMQSSVYTWKHVCSSGISHRPMLYMGANFYISQIPSLQLVDRENVASSWDQNELLRRKGDRTKRKNASDSRSDVQLGPVSASPWNYLLQM